MPNKSGTLMLVRILALSICLVLLPLSGCSSGTPNGHITAPKAVQEGTLVAVGSPVVVKVGGQELSYPLDERVEILKGGHKMEGSQLHAGVQVRITILDGKIIRLEIL